MSGNSVPPAGSGGTEDIISSMLSMNMLTRGLGAGGAGGGINWRDALVALMIPLLLKLLNTYIPMLGNLRWSRASAGYTRVITHKRFIGPYWWCSNDDGAFSALGVVRGPGGSGPLRSAHVYASLRKVVRMQACKSRCAPRLTLCPAALLI